MKKQRNTANIVIGGKDYSKYLTLPLAFQDTGVEQLDSAIVELRGMREGAQFRPFLEVSLFNGRYTYVVADDVVTEVYGRGVYNHELTLIEPTKLMERVLMEAKSFTQPLFREIGEPMPAEVYEIKDIRAEILGFEILNWLDSTKIALDKNGYKSPYIVPQTSIPSIEPYAVPIYSPRHLMDIFETKGDYFGIGWTVSVYYGNSSTAFTEDDPSQELLGSFSIGEEENKKFYIPKEDDGYARTGVYTLKYKGVNQSDTIHLMYVVPLSVYDTRAQTERATPYSVLDVIKIVLETAHPLFGDEEPIYKLDLTESQMERWGALESPEFHFANGRSLYENLKDIGDFLHALPRVRIVNGERLVYFQELGDRRLADLSKGIPYGSIQQFSSSDYANAVETNFENLINVVDEADGSVTDPFTDGFISLRSTNFRIKEGDSYIPTNFPIGSKIKRVIVSNAIAGDEVLNNIDITPAVFEENEYNLLSSFSGTFPFSRTFALYYKTGQKNIDGLWYRAEDNPSEFLNYFQRYAITNVINHFAKRNYGEYDYDQLMFQITYVPFINGRARQERTEYLGGERMVLSHNQSANQLSADAFGENLRGKVAMLANATETKLYVFKTIDDLPKAGEMYDSKQFISLVTARVFPSFCICQITLTENYNSIGAFAQLKTGIRQYEIPAGQKRCTLIEEFCVIGKNENADNSDRLCTDKLVSDTIYAFSSNPPVAALPFGDITTAWVRTFDENKNIIANSIALPIYSAAIGNSVYFGFSFADNFSAGTQSIDIGKADARGIRDVQYGTPIYAKAKYLRFVMARSVRPFGSLLNTAHSLPSIEGEASYINQYISTERLGDLKLNKDAADACQIAYQLHFCSNSGYIITSEFAKMMPYVRSDNDNSFDTYKAYFYNSQFDELTGETKGEIVAASDIQTISTAKLHFITIKEIPSAPYKSFAIAKENGKIVIAKNTSQADKEIYFNFKRKR